MVLSIGERIKGFLFSPSATFDASKEDTIGDAFKYFIVILAIYAVIVTIIVAVALSWILNFLATTLPPGTLPPRAALMFGAGGGAVFAVTSFIQVFIGGIIGVFIVGLWTHIWVYLVGGRKGIEQTIKALMYGYTPGYLFVWIPVVNVIWALIVGAIGIRQLHELSTGKAVLAVLIAIAIPAIIIGAIVVALIAAMSGPGFPGATGPGFGGF